MSAPVVVVGAGPAGLLAASLAVSWGARCTVVAAGAGSLPLWGGGFSFRDFDAAGRPVRDPWAAWAEVVDHPGQGWSVERWRQAWGWLLAHWRAIGIPVAADPPAANRWTLTCTGQLQPTFVVPEWQYAVPDPEPLALVGLAGLVDSMATWAAAAFERQTGCPAVAIDLPNPPAWRPDWGPMHWAHFLEGEEGLAWLMAQLEAAMARLAPKMPVLLPQVVGVGRTSAWLDRLQRRLGRRVYEYPLPPPSVGGIRLLARWRHWLLRAGVRWVPGRVVETLPQGVVLADGQTLSGRVVLATGGVAGGGLLVAWDGRIVNTANGQVVGRADDAGAVLAAGLPRATAGFAVAGRLCRGCDPDRHGDGGAVNLWSAHVAVAWALGGEALNGVGQA